MRRRQRLQRPERLQERVECLQGPERLQGPGVLGHDQGPVRLRQGQVHAGLTSLFRSRRPAYVGLRFHDRFTCAGRLWPRVEHAMNVASKLPPIAAPADREGVSAKPPFLGFGLGLRAQHYDEILSDKPPIDWFEVISENYMLPGGQPLRVLDRIRGHYPVVMHGVSLSIASTAPPDFDYLRALR